MSEDKNYAGESGMENELDNTITETKHTLLDDGLYLQDFFAGADLEKQKKMGERLIKAAWDGQWDPNEDPIVGITSETQVLPLEDEDAAEDASGDDLFEIVVNTKNSAFLFTSFKEADNQNAFNHLVFEALRKLSECGSEAVQNEDKPLPGIYCTAFLDYDLYGKGHPEYFMQHQRLEPVGIKIKLPYNVSFVDVRNQDKSTALGQLNYDLTQDNPQEFLDPTFKERGMEM